MDGKTEVKLLSLVSFCVLMQHGEGIMGKDPTYIIEKAKLIKAPVYLFSTLDDENSAKVIQWGKRFGIDLEGLIKQMVADYYDIPATEFMKKYSVV